MFLREVRVVDVSAPQARRWLLTQLRRTGKQAAGDAVVAGQTALTEVGVSGFAENVVVQTLPAHMQGDSTVIPIRWVTPGLAGTPIPQLDADLLISPTADGRTRLTIIGSYRPTLELDDAPLDASQLNLVGRATATSFLDGLSKGVLTQAEPESSQHNGHPVHAAAMAAEGAVQRVTVTGVPTGAHR